MRRLVWCLILVGCVPPDAAPPPAVRGNYQLEHENKLTLKLDIGGVVHEKNAAGYDEVIDFGTHEGQEIKLDLNEFCRRDDVVCPNEALWSKVSIDQPNLRSRKIDAYVINVINNTERDLPAGRKAEVHGGFVTVPENKFLIGIGAQGESNEACGVAGIALASGRFTHKGEAMTPTSTWKDPTGAPCEPPTDEAAEDDAAECTERVTHKLTWPKGAPIDGIAEGKVAIAYLGACAFGPAIVGATLTIETPFTGTRTGEFDPPAFTPIQPPDSLPDLDDDDDGA